MVTVHGLDIGIHADMTVFSSLSGLVYNEERGSVGTIKTGNDHIFLLNPTTTPVPSAVWLVGSALAGLGFFVKRRNKS